MNDRARVPFAVVGVLLLVSAAVVAAGVDPAPAGPDDPAVERAVDRVRAASVAAVRVGVARAAADAARTPVTEPASTPAGDVVAGESPFRAYLRVRTYVSVRRSLGRVGHREESVTVSARLPETPNATALGRELERVSLVPADNGSAVRATVRNVTLVVRRRGRVVDRLRLSPTVVVRTPVLALHGRMADLELRLATPPTAPGLGRGVTARLTAIAWGRGYAQYGGAPIANVLANRHVELAANAALLDSQRAALGTADPAGRRGVAASARRVAAADLLVGAGADPAVARAVLDAAEREGAPTDPLRAARERRTTTVTVGNSADRALVDGTLPVAANLGWGNQTAVAAWLARDRAALARRVREVSVRLPRRSLVAKAPSAALQERLRARRRGLIGGAGPAPPAALNRSTANSLRRASRALYLDHVEALLSARANRERGHLSRLDGTLSELGVELTLPDTGGGGATPRTTVARVDAAPPYLTLAAVERRRVGLRGGGRIRPLAARNVNLFTVPYGDAATAITERLFGRDTVRLSTAARTLRAASGVENETLAGHRRDLSAAVAAAVARSRQRVLLAVDRSGVGTAVDRRAAVGAAFSRWRSPAARARALRNGSATRAVVEELSRRTVLTPTERAWLAARLRLAVEESLEGSARVPRDAVEGTASATRAVASRVLERGLEAGFNRTGEALKRRVGGPLSKLPSGLPVTPFPATWYATVNVWVVQVRGGYGRVVLYGDRGGRSGPLAYVRDGSVARLDYDGDGARERFGRAPRVEFDVETAVVVVVPPGGAGVGDTAGMDERSPGWRGRN